MLNIRTEKFEGPLGLLLKLIEKEEMDITEISLAKIADQYIDYLNNSERLNPEETADFLVVASRLLLLKSKAILPYLLPEEEQEIAELERQIKIYQEFALAAKEVEKILVQRNFTFSRSFDLKNILAGSRIFSPPGKLKVADLAEALREFLGKIKPREKLEEKKLEITVTIEEKIAAIQKMLINRLKLSFGQLLSQTGNKTEAIVSFLALLELVKQRQVVVDQTDLFQDIFINKNHQSLTIDL